MDCAAAEGLYGLAEGAFGSDAGAGGGEGGDSGECPAANPLTDAECGGAVSNCWSPGQPDTDCPNFGLCCFDGCANTCVDGQSMRYYYNTNLPNFYSYSNIYYYSDLPPYLLLILAKYFHKNKTGI